MAYKQNPGRSPFMKTGNGIPSALLQLKKPNYEGLKKFTSDIVEGKTSAGPLPGYVASENILKDAPAQAKHLRKNVEKNAQGTVTSWDVEQDPVKIVEQISVGRDSLNYIKPAKSAIEAKMLGDEFSRNYSPNSASGRIAIKNLSRGNYVGPDKSLNTDEAKAKVLNDLWSATIGQRSINDQELSKKFGIPDPNVYAKTPNPKSGVVKKKPAPKQMKPGSPAKQTQLAGKEPKATQPQKSDKLIKEERIAAAKAAFEKLQKSQESKGDKKGLARTEPVGKQMKPGSPMKQYIDPKEKEREQKRLNSMTEEQRARERKEGRPSDNPRPDRLRMQVEKEREEREAKRKAEKGRGTGMRGKKESPDGPMQLKSKAKMKKC